MKPNSLKILHIKKCFIVASKAEPIPPLGTILGNLGVSSSQFCG
jgi:ribosomal protein L11